MHNALFPWNSKSPEFGYPDMGNGYFSKRLPYADWYRMNNAQRCQVNFLEHLTFAVLAPLIIALSYPQAGFVIAAGIFIGRFLFTAAYSTKGPGARLPGALIMDLALFVGFGFAVTSALSLAKIDHQLDQKISALID